MQKTIPVTVNSNSSVKTNKWENLDSLVQAALATANRSAIFPFGQQISVLFRRGTAGLRLQGTSDPNSTLPAWERLVEETKDFTNTGGTSKNTISLRDKYVRVVDGADTAVDGGLITVTVDQA